KKSARELLRDGARAAHALRFTNAAKHRANQANRIDSPMSKEMLIFGRDQSIDEDLWQIVVFDNAALLAALIIKIGDQFRWQPCLGSVAAGFDDLRKRVLREFQAQRIAGFWLDRYFITADFVNVIPGTAFVGH